MGLGPVGVALTVSDTYLDEAAEVERLGYSAVWLPGGQIDRLARLADIVRATAAVRVPSAIVSVDVYPPDTVTGFYAEQEATAPGRLLVGLGGPPAARCGSCPACPGTGSASPGWDSPTARSPISLTGSSTSW